MLSKGLFSTVGFLRFYSKQIIACDSHVKICFT